MLFTKLQDLCVCKSAIERLDRGNYCAQILYLNLGNHDFTLPTTVNISHSDGFQFTFGDALIILISILVFLAHVLFTVIIVCDIIL